MPGFTAQWRGIWKGTEFWQVWTLSDHLLLQKECTEAQEEQGHSLGCCTPTLLLFTEDPHISRENLAKAPEETWLGCVGPL